MNFKAIAYFIFGLASFWVGSYFFSTFDGEHWARFPTFITTALLSIGGAVLAAAEATK